MNKNYSFYIGTLLLLVTICFICWVIYLSRTFTIVEIPTGLSFTFSGSVVEVRIVREDLLAYLRRSSLTEVYVSFKSVRFEDSKTGLSLYVNDAPLERKEISEITVFVTTKVKRANDWQMLAADIQSILIASNLKFNTAALQRDPSVYDCYKKCDISLSFPINFSILNQKELSQTKNQ